MKKLKIILQSKLFYIILFFLLIIYVFIKTTYIKYESIYTNGNIEETFIIESITYKDDKMILILSGKEKLRALYDEIIDVSINDEVLISGSIYDINETKIFNIFNYKKYLYNNKIYKNLRIESISIINKSNSLRSKIYNRCKTNKYYLLFIFKDNSLFSSDEKDIFSNIGITSVVSLSSLLLSIYLKIFKKVLKNKNVYYFISIIFLIFNLYITRNIMVIRLLLSFLIRKLSIKTFNKDLLVLSIILFINPFYIFNIGFNYYICFLLTKYFTKFHKKNKFLNVFYLFLFSLPITINLNYEINLISIFINVPITILINIIIYPLCIISFIFPKLLLFLNMVTFYFERLITILNDITFLTISIPRLNIIYIIIYYFLLIMSIYYNYTFSKIVLVILLIFIKTKCYLDPNYYIYYFDVGQGDCSVVISPYKKEVVMIDTGGNEGYHVSENVIIFLKSIGIYKVDLLIITHGDSDHCLDSNYLIEKLTIKNIYLNKGDINDLEQNILIEKVNVNNYVISSFNIKNLYTGIYDNENDNSLVIYFDLYDTKFLFMGDASVTREKDILKQYNLNDIDFLKVGHHGSDTSSSKEFINSIKPKYSIISVGKNNYYGHPKESVLNILEKSKIYRTDIDGSIEVKLNKVGYKIRTYQS